MEPIFITEQLERRAKTDLFVFLFELSNIDISFSSHVFYSFIEGEGSTVNVGSPVKLCGFIVQIYTIVSQKKLTTYDTLHQFAGSLFPGEILNNFDGVRIENDLDMLTIYLDEQSLIPFCACGYKIESKGFLPGVHLRDFPINAFYCRTIGTYRDSRQM